MRSVFETVLIANRGVAAVRIARTLRHMGIRSVGVRSPFERKARYFENFDEVVDVEGTSVADTYLNVAQILCAAEASGAQAIHPGYGFLSESADFARETARCGLKFIGPRADSIELFGLKHRAREAAQAAGVALLAGTELLESAEDALAAAQRLGYPVMLKSTAGGGGIGMQRCDDAATLADAFERVVALASANFSSAGVYLEKCIQAPRHVEVQVFGDGDGEVVALGDRDCSLQRRHQKLVEECPAPALPDDVRHTIHQQAISLMRANAYESAGTVEFLYDAMDRSFYFLEVNTRLQVEHGVTERVYGLDLVEWMVRQAAGTLEPLESLAGALTPNGFAIQARLYAEDPYLDCRPSPGPVTTQWGEHERVDTWLTDEDEVSAAFDPMLANVICAGPSRAGAINRLHSELGAFELHGIATNQSYLREALALDDFRAGEMTTHSLESLVYQPHEFEVVQSGLQTTVQSYPGRQLLWEVGVPPSSPMDERSFRLGNRLLGNFETAPGLEMVLEGVTLDFRSSARVIVVGATADIRLDDQHLACWECFDVAPGQRLQIGRFTEGMRGYLLVRGGIDVPDVLGSSTTFTLGGMGGHQGRTLRAGDVLSWNEAEPAGVTRGLFEVPSLKERHNIRMLMGPHAAPDFFTTADIERLFSAKWQVDHNSSRTGVRLIGPQPEWARSDGGEAGLHPSNIHDNAYAFAALDFTGDMPVLLGPDGPSLGGFVCPAVTINADRWKLGQLVPGDEVTFTLVSEEEARQADIEQETWLAQPYGVPMPHPPCETRSKPAQAVLWRADLPLPVVIRRAGEEWLLVEFGEAELDIRLRVVVHQFVELLRQSNLPGLLEMTPGIRSLQIRYDRRRWRPSELVREVQPILSDAARVEDVTLPSRIVRMPLSWNDPACLQAIERYVSSVRSNAPWCPDNIEFIRRINGLEDAEAVRRIVFDASYLVMGLGDVYLGAPVATPVDPRHRLVTTKYNPARTWTAENSVGIGGAYLCVYGMEGPGGYQFVGRTVPVWNQRGFGRSGRSWLLNHFDQLQFVPVDAETLLDMREAARMGAYLPEIEDTTFDLAAYTDFLTTHEGEIAAFNAKRETAFQAELEHWREHGLDRFEADASITSSGGSSITDGRLVESPVAASVLTTHAGGEFAENAEILVLEAMKTEFSIRTPVSGVVEILVEEGQSVAPGQALAVVR